MIDDSEAMYLKGDVITIASNVALKEYNPRLSDGMKMVVPVVADEEKEGRTYYMLYGMYYVTQDDYVISAFDETAAKSTIMLSGLKVNALLDELKK